ncbi:hypothetical protein BU25DRAFT_174874 [Macroventuria anomochaeta]|uniref:Uncharacterized protein n=1 Tax=Macroventuria anomochaeta TaxID=301207 RepID=A0ACB6RNG7_9PLEO|nr:uncharacterized protein BU25DRAFT_174874 [Macroventuria anomochaeta]KAF2623490.1 hypothetical protein BU25DRAFT_174874 [Macroventuria anomochaeta]
MNQVSTSMLPHLKCVRLLISSLPPDCLRAATVTARRRSEVLHVIFLLLTPQHYFLFIPAVHQHHVRPRKTYQLTDLRLRGSETFYLTSCNGIICSAPRSVQIACSSSAATRHGRLAFHAAIREHHRSAGSQNNSHHGNEMSGTALTGTRCTTPRHSRSGCWCAGSLAPAERSSELLKTCSTSDLSPLQPHVQGSSATTGGFR